ncbi:hypothetical protein [Sphingomonas sp. Leaf21]|uniref:hypothetical protein n=1 Tax=Sphingomonas sp. Leaf21 TaxID=2876550 RepID=UPI001E5CC960|nr:hypothetical protein [Sphingomonas sp. Leaf21]
MNGMLKKLGLGIALGATALTAAAPAEAQRWGRGWGGYYHRDRGGDAVAGALLGGIVGLGVGAAIASSNQPRYVDRGYYYNRGYDPYYAPPPPPPVAYQYQYRSYAPRCWNDWRWDPYWGRNVPVQVCN